MFPPPHFNLVPRGKLIPYPKRKCSNPNLYSSPRSLLCIPTAHLRLQKVFPQVARKLLTSSPSPDHHPVNTKPNTKQNLPQNREQLHVSELFFFLIFRFTCSIQRFPCLGMNRSCSCPAYATATAMLDLSCACNLHHGSWQQRILNPEWGHGLNPQPHGY